MTDRKTRPDVEAALAEIDLIESRTFLPRNDPDYFTGRQQREALRATLTKLVRDAVEAERLWVEGEIRESLHALRLVCHPPEIDSDGRAFADGAIHNLVILRRKIRARAGGSDA